MIPTSQASYRALLSVPSLPRILVSMAVARVAGAMLSIAIILFTLSHYRSPELAGLVTFVSIFPGLVVSPIAGALLDRHGRLRLVMVAYFVGAGSLGLIGVLALADSLPAWLLVVIAFAASLTGPLSNTGVRTLFPIIVPEHLWERVNAVDSNGYLASTLIGPPAAAAMVQLIGGPTTLLIIGAMLAVGAIVLIGVREPATASEGSGHLLRDAAAGVGYVFRNRSLRGLGLAMTALNLGGGVLTIVVPIIVIERLHISPIWVGISWGLSGAAGMITALAFGRLDSRGREKGWMVWSAAGSGLAMALLLLGPSLPVLLLSMALTGLFNGPLDIALFTLRQRRVSPMWMGRAIAVSASLNFMGYPIGAAISGALVSTSLETVIAFGMVACLIGSFFAWWEIPREVPARQPA